MCFSSVFEAAIHAEGEDGCTGVDDNSVDATELMPTTAGRRISWRKDTATRCEGVSSMSRWKLHGAPPGRGRAVPEDICGKMAGYVKPPTFEEGFRRSTVVR